MKKESLGGCIEKKQNENNKEPEETAQISKAFEVDMPGYLDNLLHHSKKTVFIFGNNVNIINSSPKKRIIKKKKIKKEIIKTENEKKNEIDIKGNKKNKILKNKNNALNKERNNSTNNEKNEIKKDKIKQYSIKNLEISKNEIYPNEENLNNKGKNHLKDNQKNLEYNQKLSVYKKYCKFYKLILFHQIKEVFKSVYIFVKMKNCMNSSANKIISNYNCYISNHNFKMDYIIYKIMSAREQFAKKIISNLKSYFFRKSVKKLLKKTENNNIIYSSINIDKRDILYFKYKHKSGKEQNFYFEYSPVLKCFIFFINKNNDKYLRIIEGNFYSSKSIKLIDKFFEVNNKGENIINIPKLFQKAEIISEKNDRILYRFLKLNKSKKRMTIDEYEDSKKKSKDDYSLKKSSKCQKLNKLGGMSRSKSFIKIEGENKRKSILKPSRSYVNLKNAEKKIQFGKAKIRKYKNKKD